MATFEQGFRWQAPDSDCILTTDEAGAGRDGMMVCRDHFVFRISEPADHALVLSPDCPVPNVPGVYIRYFRSVPAMVPISDCVERYGGHLLYVGISPATNRNPQSRQTLRSRIRYHFRGNAAGSTLRRTLSVLLDSFGCECSRQSDEPPPIDHHDLALQDP